MWNRFWRLLPLAPAVGLLLLGIALARATSWPVGFDLALLALALVTAICAELARLRPWVCQGALALALFCSGSALWRIDQQSVPMDHLVRLLPGEISGTAPPRAIVRVRLTILSDPEANRPPEDLPTLGRSPRQRFLGELSALETATGWIPCSGTVGVCVPRQIPLASGQQIELAGWATRPLAPANPGTFDYRRYLAASRIFVQLGVPRVSQVRLLDANPHHLSWSQKITCALTRTRFYLRYKLANSIALPTDDSDEDDPTSPGEPDAAGIPPATYNRPSPGGVPGQTLATLLLGHRDPAVQDVAQAFSDAGVAHLLAISGTHVVLVAGVFWWLLRFIFPRPRWRAPATALLVLAYMLATPTGPPVLRAGLATILFLAAAMLSRRTSALNILLATLAVVLLIRPADMLDAGCQLSFVTAAGLILLGPRLHRALFGDYLDRHAAIARAIGTRLAAGLQRLRILFCGALAANLVGATLAAPLVAFHFHQFNALAIITGLIMFPTIMVLLAAALVQLLAALVWPGLAGILATLVYGGTWINLVLVDFLARLPGVCLALRPPPPWLVILLYAGVLLWLTRHLWGWSRATVSIGLLSLLTLTAGWYTITARGWGAGGSQLHTWSLDVGTGSCLVIETPRGHRLLIDGGSTSRPGLTRQITAPFLAIHGIGTVDSLILTELSFPHASGAAEFVERYRPVNIYLSTASLTRPLPNYAATEILGQLRQTRTRPIPLHAGDRLHLDPDTTLHILWPPARPVPTLPENQCGLILRLDYQPAHAPHEDPAKAVQSLLLVHPDQDTPLALIAAAGELQNCSAALLLGPGPASPVVTSTLQKAGITTLYGHTPPGRSLGTIHLATK